MFICVINIAGNDRKLPLQQEAINFGILVACFLICISSGRAHMRGIKLELLYLDEYPSSIYLRDLVNCKKNTQYERWNNFDFDMGKSGRIVILKISIFLAVIFLHVSAFYFTNTSHHSELLSEQTTLEISFVSSPNVQHDTKIFPAKSSPIEPAEREEKKSIITQSKSAVILKKKITKIASVTRKVMNEKFAKPENKGIYSESHEDRINYPVVKPVMTMAKFDANYLHNPRPEYPDVSIRLHEEGIVMLKVFVSESGSAESILIEKSSGFQRLDQSALEVVKTWKFISAKQGSVNIPSWVIVPVSFKLEDE